MADETIDLQQARAMKEHRQATKDYLDSRAAAVIETRTWADMHWIDHRLYPKGTPSSVVRLWSQDSHFPVADIAYMDDYDEAIAYATDYNWKLAHGEVPPPDNDGPRPDPMTDDPFTVGGDDDLADIAP